MEDPPTHLHAAATVRHDAPAAASRESRGYAKGLARREAIVEVATSYFARVGYQAATMLQIAAVCGISRTGLLHHFPTKESLLEAVLSRRDEVDDLRLRRNGDRPPDALLLLADLVALVAHNATVPAIVNLFAVLSAEAGDPSHPAHGYFVRRYQDSRERLRRSFLAAREQGVLAPDADPDALAIELVALMDGLQVQWLLDRDGIDMAAAVRRRIESVLLRPLPAAPD